MKIAIKNKVNLIKKNERYPNMIPSRYAVILVISIFSIILYSMVEVLNFSLSFTEMNEINYLYPVAIVYSFSYAALSYGIPNVKKWMVW